MYSRAFKEAPNIEDGTEPQRKSTRLKRRPTGFSIADKSLTKRTMLAIVLSAIASSTRVFRTQVGGHTLPESTRLPTLPQGEDVCFGRFFNDLELDKLSELTTLDRLNETPDYHWGIERVLNHRTRKVVQRIPRYFDTGALSVNYKVQLHVQFLDGVTQWTTLVDAARNENPIPLIVYAQEITKLGRDKGFLSRSCQ
jgi:hypothetical protein